MLTIYFQHSMLTLPFSGDIAIDATSEGHTDPDCLTCQSDYCLLPFLADEGIPLAERVAMIPEILTLIKK